MNDCFGTIKRLIDSLGGRQPTREDAMKIQGALHEAYERLMKVRPFAPTTDYSERIWELLELAGFPNKSLAKKAAP